MEESIVLFFPDAGRRQALAARLAALGFAARAVDAVAAAALPGNVILLTEDAAGLRAGLAARPDAGPILILAGDPPASPEQCACTVLPIPREPSDGELRIALTAARQMARLACQPLAASGDPIDVAEYRAAVAALRESEEKFRLLFEHAPLGIGLVLPDSGLIVNVNPELCRMFGYTAAELTQKTIADLTHPDDIAVSQKRFGDMRSGVVPHYTIEKRYLHKDGHAVWARSVGTAIHDASGKVIYAIGIVEDISESREAERLRIESLERQRDVLVREVHHRIKNNLQGVISLIEQLKRKQPAAADALEEAAGQVSTIAVVHGLHSSTLSAEVRPRQLVRAIVDSVARLSDAVIDIDESGGTPGWEWRIGARDTVAIALVINELIYNAIKHNAPAGAVEVRHGGQSGGFGVRVFNRPARLPPGFDLAAGRGLGTGLSLITSLLPRQGARLVIREFADGVEAHLQLSHPCANATPTEGKETTP